MTTSEGILRTVHQRSYEYRRELAEKSVCSFAATNGFQLGGSWANGTFHLSKESSESFSDIDAVSLGSKRHYQALVALAIGSEFLALRLSVHPEAYEGSLDIRSQQLMAVLNWISNLKGSPSQYSYHTCKAYLVAGRRHRSDTYSDRILARNDPHAARALGVKLGFRSAQLHLHDPIEQAVKALASAHLARSGLNISLARDSPAESIRDAVALLIDQLDIMPGLSIAFINYLKTKYLMAVSL